MPVNATAAGLRDEVFAKNESRTSRSLSRASWKAVRKRLDKLTAVVVGTSRVRLRWTTWPMNSLNRLSPGIVT